MREKSCLSRYDFIAHGWISGGAHAREKLLLSVRFYRVRMDIGRCACARKVATLDAILSRTNEYRAVRMREKSCFSRCDFIAYRWISSDAHAREKCFSRYDLVHRDRYRAVRMREKSCFSQCDFIAHGWISGDAHAREKLLLSVRFYRV